MRRDTTEADDLEPTTDLYPPASQFGAAAFIEPANPIPLLAHPRLIERKPAMGRGTRPMAAAHVADEDLLQPGARSRR